jgi:uncharacterized protein (TIGR02246 family)
MTNEEEIKALAEQWADAVRRRDFDALLEHYAEDVVVFDVPPPLQVKGRDQYRKNMERWLGNFKGSIECEMNELTITATDEIAFAHSLTRISDTMEDGTSSGSWVRATVCYRKFGGRWLVVHEHASLPFDGMTAQSVVDLVP